MTFYFSVDLPDKKADPVILFVHDVLLNGVDTIRLGYDTYQNIWLCNIPTQYTVLSMTLHHRPPTLQQHIQPACI